MDINTFDDRSVRKIADTVAYVDNITQGQPASQRQFGNNDFKVKLTSETVTTGEWNATEVIWDGSAFAVPSDAELWDSDTPLIVSGADGAVDDILSAEALTDTNQDTVWLALKPEGGGGALWAKITSGSGQAYLGDIYDDPIETNPALETGATVNAYNVDFGDVPIGRIYRCDLVGSVSYIEPSTFGG